MISTVKPLTFPDYRSYGDIISARDEVKPLNVNMGTAKKFGFLASLQNLRGESAKPNFCFFRCQPQVQTQDEQFEVKLLERHPYSTQAFIPMKGAERFLVIVALGKDQPDLSTLRVFQATAEQGITYHPGVWHHPLVAMDQLSDFACLVWEDGTQRDCDVVKLSAPVTVTLSRNSGQ